MDLDERVVSRLDDAKEGLTAEGRLLPLERLEGCFALFRERFGPLRLLSLSGQDLLETMHLHANHDSLVYWLEFKDDYDFPARFGSIAGGSALKFGIYRRKETGAWMKGHATAQVAISLEEAVAIAVRHRDQLVAGSRLLDALPRDASKDDYDELQRRLEDQAPDIQDTSWGHKYLSLMHPGRLDDFHTVDFQDFNLVRCLQTPPDNEGRYLAAHQFVEMAVTLGVPLNHLTKILNRANGRPRRTWRVGTRVSENGTENVLVWPKMRALGVAAIGWDALGDLEHVGDGREAKADLARTLLEHKQYADKKTATRKAGEIIRFIHAIAEGDLVVAADGETVLGVGTVRGAYHYAEDAMPGAPNRRAVEWLDTTTWKLPRPGEGLMTTCVALEDTGNLIALERKLLAPHADEPPPIDVPPRAKVAAARPAVRLRGVPGRLQDILERKYQAILHGPPGTGKTHWAMRTARDLAAVSAFGEPYGGLDDAKKAEVDGHAGARGLVRTCTFHPGYGYEDFLEGFRPSSGTAQQLTFTLRDGLFKSLCADAAANPGREHFLVIDEINRGDIPRIFGELITLLERDKRGRTVELAASGAGFAVPANVRVIGTMNTADRSIALLDTALRRRFGFVELLPDYAVLADTVVGGIPLGPWLQAVNARIRAHVGRDAENLQIGHAFLLEGERPIADAARLARIVAEDIVPLLKEYCYEDIEKLAKILGSGLVDVDERKVKDELFRPERQDDLMKALLQPSPDIVTTRGATTHEDDDAVAERGDDGEDEEDETAS